MKNELNYRLITKKYRQFFLPTLAITTANNLAAFADTILVSVFLGVGRMPAIQLCFPAMALLNFFQTMFGIGGSLLAANAQADHDGDRGNRLFSATVMAVVITGCLAALAGTLLKPWIVPLLCRDPALRDDVSVYYSVLVLGFPLMCFLLCLSYFVRADGCAKLASRSILISNAVNLCMDCVFMKGLGWGLTGAALATIAGYICGITYLLIAYIRYPKRQFRFQPQCASGTAWIGIKAICAKGIPTASIWLYLLVNVQVLNNLILSYGGATGMQAFSICKNSLSLGSMFFLGTAQTMQPIVGVYAHEGDYERTRYILVHSIRIVFAAAIILAAIFAVFSRGIVKMYGTVEPQTAAYFSRAIRIYGLALPGIGFSQLMTYYFQAIDRKGLAAILTALEALLPAGLCCALAPRMQMSGIWAGLVAGEFVSMLVIFAILLWDRQKSQGARRFLLPVHSDRYDYAFSVEMALPSAVKMSEEASRYMENRVGHRRAGIVCLALEEMLTGIVLASNGTKGTIDVSIQDAKEEIVLSIRDMGVGFNPLVHDDKLDYAFDNAAVLQKIASEIKYDLSLGMNATTIRLKKDAAAWEK